MREGRPEKDTFSRKVDQPASSAPPLTSAASRQATSSYSTGAASPSDPPTGVTRSRSPTDGPAAAPSLVSAPPHLPEGSLPVLRSAMSPISTDLTAAPLKASSLSRPRHSSRKSQQRGRIERTGAFAASLMNASSKAIDPVVAGTGSVTPPSSSPSPRPTESAVNLAQHGGPGAPEQHTLGATGARGAGRAHSSTPPARLIDTKGEKAVVSSIEESSGKRRCRSYLSDPCHQFWYRHAGHDGAIRPIGRCHHGRETCHALPGNRERRLG